MTRTPSPRRCRTSARRPSTRASGFDGAGVTVAILDSGIDYTHAAFGGAGTAAAYNDAYGSNTADPDNKDEPNWNAIDDDTNIVGGFDFVGEDWPFGPLDPTPIRSTAVARTFTLTSRPRRLRRRHGTHVADIAGGVAGVAPGVEMHAVKVCRRWPAMQRRRAAARHGLRPRPERRRAHR